MSFITENQEMHTARSFGAHKRFSVGRFLAWAVLVLFMLGTLFPFYWMLRTALSTTTSLPTNPGSFLPVDFTFGAISRVVGLESPAEALKQGGSGASMNFLLYMRNSFIVASVTTVFQVFSCSMAGYAFSRLRWPGRNAVFFAFISALMIPGIFTTLPNFLLMRDLHLINTFLGIMLPGLLMAPFSVFFMRQFFLGISREIEEAAMIDGANHWQRFIRVVIPISASPIITLSLLTFIAVWNDYMWPLLVGSADNVRTLNVALGIFRSQTPQLGPDWAGLMAAALIAAIPIIVLYLVLGKRIINSIGFSGIK